MQLVRRKRRQKLINPSLQWGLIGSFGGVALLAMLLQFLFFGFFMLRAARNIEGVGGEVAAAVPGAMVMALWPSLLLVPVFLVVGIALTHRIAGPAYRFEQYLKAVASGEETRPCRIRKGDRLQSLCDAINKVTEPLRDEAQQAEARKDNHPFQATR